MLYAPTGMAVDGSGDLFIADNGDGVVREVNAATQVITTVAGNGAGGPWSPPGSGFSGDNGPATAAQLGDLQAIAVDGSGDLFIVDMENSVIRDVNAATQIITTVVGNGTQGYSGDNGPATAAELSYPQGIAVDSSGDLFIADAGNNVIREVNVSTHVITTVAGDATQGYSGDNGPATAAELSYPQGIAVDGSGDLFIADYENNVIRKVNAATHAITTVAGNGTQGYSGDNGPATAAELNYPQGIAVDGRGNLFIVDANDNVIREVNIATGVITTVAGNGTGGSGGDDGPATAAEIDNPAGIATDAGGDLFISTQVVIMGYPAASSGGNGAGTAKSASSRRSPWTAAATRWLPASKRISIREVFAGTPLVVAPAATTTALTLSATSIVFGQTETLTATVASDASTPSGGTVTFYDGTATLGAASLAGGTGDHGQLAGGGSDVCYRHLQRRRRKTLQGSFSPIGVGPNSIIAKVAGIGVYSGDNGPATAAELNGPYSVAVDASGDLFIADTDNNVIREVNSATG